MHGRRRPHSASERRAPRARARASVGAQYDHRGQVVKDSGAYIGAEGRKVGQLETFKPKPFAQAKKGSAAVSYDIKEPPPHEQKGPKRVDSRRPASARRRSAPKEAWGAAGVGGAGRRDERQMTAAVAAAFGAMRRAQLRELEQQQRQASSSPGSGGARGFAGNPRNQRGRAAGPAAADGSSRRPQLEHGPVGRFIPPAPPVIVRSAELADSERPRTSGGAEAAAQPGGARRPSSAHARRASGASTARVQVDRVAWARERHEQSMRERHRPQTARTNRAAYDPWATGRRAPDSLRGPPSPAHAGAERAAELDAADIARRRASNAPATMEAARAGGGRLTRGAAFGGGRAGSGGGREPSELMLELLDL